MPPRRGLCGILAMWMGANRYLNHRSQRCPQEVHMHVFPQPLCVASSSEDGAAPRNKPWKAGAVENWHSKGGPQSPSLPLCWVPRQGKPLPWAASFYLLPSLLLSLPFPLSPSQEKGFWLLASIAWQRTGRHRLTGAAQMLPNEGAEMRG